MENFCDDATTIGGDNAIGLADLEVELGYPGRPHPCVHPAVLPPSGTKDEVVDDDAPASIVLFRATVVQALGRAGFLLPLPSQQYMKGECGKSPPEMRI